MKFINVIDEEVKNTLLLQKCNPINTIKDIHGKEIWIFEYNPSLFCLNINDENLKNKCFFSNSSTMTF